jgi:gliding motility-associated-like protein
MSDRDIFKDVFSKKLRNFESEVNPKLWSSISEKMVSSNVVSAKTGVSISTKFIVGSIVAVSVIGGYFYLNFVPPPVSSHLNSNPATVNKSRVQSKELDKKDDISIISVNNALPLLTICNEFKVAEHEEIISETEATPIQLKKESSSMLSPDVIIVPNEEVEKSQIDEVVALEVSNVKEIEKVNTVLSSSNEVSVSSIESLPNVFSPNGDGIYDVFTVKSKGLRDYSLVILDSKNQIVFKTDDPHFSWDGLAVNGNMVESGDYLYYITAYNSEGKLVSKSSYLKIVK